MRGSNQKILLMMVLVVLATARGEETGGGFVTWANNYYLTWGHQALVINKTSELHLTLDHNSGSGFESQLIYGSGYFNVRIKAPQTKSTGVITSFYLISRSSRHDELCFQILGRNGSPYLLNTNMYLYGVGGKDQRFRLWFDPTKDYHSYSLLWNPNQLVFYVDDTPIRVYRKNPNVYYPSVQTMFLMGSVKNGSVIDPKQMTYVAKFQASKIEGCKTDFMGIDKCTDPSFWWNRKQLSSKEKKLYINARKMYLDYDYCSDRQRYPKVPQECGSYS
ncbi:PREDICTED: probable xyloglucan endotransglucosylase/hydrolase protein 11 isoform X1 [Camelina sativa]|uniref:Xyloglucan endotransglucosylase/hydrolase n=1 Tax=Camelina sativa TaxID=90675 RepID=A0ABM0ZFX3_CAMSA|nr:PREDICTED: probable xyloglucan endotransglucosylase/hydrolase protein 11 isoform X2 [Camelina sativa]XP_010515179.1 PREDICTED: probable xyloglucan endotransglucosylase/hydrolase protein 11 isoform X1 [Camelina sativa]